jgi:hypothetical protein
MWYWYGHVAGFDERVGMATYDPNRDKAIGTSETKQKTQTLINGSGRHRFLLLGIRLETVMMEAPMTIAAEARAYHRLHTLQGVSVPNFFGFTVFYYNLSKVHPGIHFDVPGILFEFIHVTVLRQNDKHLKLRANDVRTVVVQHHSRHLCVEVLSSVLVFC